MEEEDVLSNGGGGCVVKWRRRMCCQMEEEDVMSPNGSTSTDPIYVYVKFLRWRLLRNSSVPTPPLTNVFSLLL